MNLQQKKLSLLYNSLSASDFGVYTRPVDGTDVKVLLIKGMSEILGADGSGDMSQVISYVSTKHVL
jgi:hypothetical protein